ncbi:MAG TPA: LLM class F420-dependent oxidoreductase [Acidimicrobiales bacterium]|nr:LLM class F420-dependent oxidoreductase [Acidimicrobiales bacterium]
MTAERKPVALPKLGVLPPVRAGACADPDWILPFAVHAETLGYESVVAVEHPLVIGGYTSRYPYAPSGRMPLPNDCPVPDPLDLLAYIASGTSRLGLSTGVVVLPAHHPVVLAKRLATIDALSKGRLRLCVGVGWMREELEACGSDFETRGRRTDESIDVLRALWSDCGEDGASFDGEFFRFANAHSFPKPHFPKPHGKDGIPIHIGGHSRPSIRRAALRGDGWQPLGLAGDELRSALKSLAEETEKAGRDVGDVEITLGDLLVDTNAERLAKLASFGASRVVLSCLNPDLDAARDELSSAADRVGLLPL